MQSGPTALEGRRLAHRADAGARPTPREFRDVTGLFATGVTVVTTGAGHAVHAMTANAFTAVSLEPLLVLVSLRRGCTVDELLHGDPAFSLSLLSAEQQPLAAWFADRARPAGAAQLDGIGWSPGRTSGAPLLDGALGWVECRVEQRVDAGDHVLVVGRVLDLRRGSASDPLVFFRGAYAELTAAPACRAAG